MQLQISEEALRKMQEDAEQTFPDECCGFFFGMDGEIRLINEAVPVENSKEGDKRRRFEISPLQYMKAEQYALEKETMLLGVYHSHPNHPAKPSEHDRAVALPFFSYIIFSVMDGKTEKITSWRLNDDRQFEEEKILEPDLSLNK